MSQRIKVRISRLRDIGWAEWDPIGLRNPDGWENDPAADEYDSYLLQVAGILINGGSEQEAVDDLIYAEADRMGGGITATTRERALRTVELIDQYVRELRAENQE